MTELENPGQLQAKVITPTRVLSAATGNVAYTGLGFRPKALIADLEVGAGTGPAGSHGQSGTDLTSACQYSDATGLLAVAAVLCFAVESAIAYQFATVVSYDADGFTLAWTKTGVPTVTASMNILAINF